ncbi:adenosine deaminase [Candidatus Methylobacter oryzae]|uniref:adenosine deaminase n=1 Tax=Candidatus Methylobacter oryzae TaxID=2497749 RepID=A0ABY3C6L1_9GAMM|nr:adenosine deaminase [Candidatus Methylobacter oryzae]TRW91226.1 adenosine deaminase [Candidatus Methylobacter oryzae]
MTTQPPSRTVKLLLLTYIFLLTGCSKNLDIAPAAEKIANQPPVTSNAAATSNYYNELIAGTTPKIADLTLFTNMLPKGGDLHHHYSGAIYAETYLDWLDKTQSCICSGNECKSKTDPEPIPKFGIVKNPPSGTCISAQELRTNKKYTAFYRDLLKRWSDKDFGNHVHEQNAPDQQFFDTFAFFGPVSDYSYREGLQSLKERAVAENVLYLETMLKSAPTLENPDLAKKLNALNANSADRQVEEALSLYFDFMAASADAKAAIDKYVGAHQEAVAGIDGAGFKLRFQAYVSRNSSPAKVFSGLYSSFSAAKQNSLIVGVNMVGPENGYVAMRDYSLHMKMLRFLRQRFPEVKLALHAGELVLGMVPPEGLKHHINEAVQVAGADRIGHGVDITHESNAYELLTAMKQRNAAVEINLSSNAFILGVKDEVHPLQLYRQYAVPFVIATDDAGVSRNNLSHEYLLFASRYKPSYGELKTVVYNSIHHSFLNEDQKREEFRELDRRFAAFEEKISTMARSRKTYTAVAGPGI